MKIAEYQYEGDEPNPGSHFLRHLKDLGTHALREARLDPKASNDAVNWSRCRILSAERWEDDEGTLGYRLWITGAAPEATDLHAFVREFIRKAGYTAYIASEW